MPPFWNSLCFALSLALVWICALGYNLAEAPTTACTLPGVRDSLPCDILNRFAALLPQQDTHPRSHHIKTDSTVEVSGLDNTTTTALVLSQFSGYLALLESLPPATASRGPMSEVDMSLEDIIVLLEGTSLRNKVVILSRTAQVRRSSRLCARSLQKYAAQIHSSIYTVFVSSEFAIEAARLVAEENSGSLSRSHISKNRAAARLQSACLHNLKMFDIISRQLQRLVSEMHEGLMHLETNLALLADSVYTEALADAERSFWETPSRLWGAYVDFWVLPHTRKSIDVLLRVSSRAKMMKSSVLGMRSRLELLQINLQVLQAQTDAKLSSDGTVLEDFIIGLKDGCAKLKGHIKSVKQDESLRRSPLYSIILMF
ncbi:hypothetical protein NLJ89_g11341 [Agrocybe chaxingu]|uniref:Uncharacterized protein n=1 Tax=Agrocybe chaxingu TaxID=84603 RepID=A0A9W8JQ49_9AGAR|nr:hypothetical protein NLJ89_g11341 [Agrocybe chaxingu]